MNLGLAILLVLGLIAALFAVAAVVERARLAPLLRLRRPAYVLGLGVYCSSWTFYGAVGSAVRDGWAYLPIYLAPVLLLLAAPRFLSRLARAVAEERASTVSDFIAARFGHDVVVARLVTVIALLGTVPYIALQFRSIGNALSIASGRAVEEPAIVATAVLLVVWETCCIVFEVPEIILPRPSKIFTVFVARFDILMAYCWDTLWTTMIGFLLAIAGGLVLGLAVGASPFVYSGLYPLLIAFNAVPKVALVPILMIWVGVGALPAVITAFVISFFPIVVNVATGLATIEPEMRDVLRSLGATRLEILTKVGIPRAMPYLFASLKVAITLAFIGSVIAETVGGNNGIGFLMLSASARNDAPTTFAGLFAIAIMGVAMYAICALVEKRMTRWAFRGEIVG